LNYFNERAVQIHEKAIEINPQDTYLKLAWGKCNALNRMARCEEAIKAYD